MWSQEDQTGRPKGETSAKCTTLCATTEVIQFIGVGDVQYHHAINTWAVTPFCG
jgi:hypothetical protein